MINNLKELYIYKMINGVAAYPHLFFYDFLGIVENYKSIIWHEKFNDAGEFELVLHYTQEAAELLIPGNYIFKTDINSDLRQSFMMIEEVNIVYDSEEGDVMTVKGSSSNALLRKRIVWSTMKFQNHDLQDAIYQLVLKNCGLAASNTEEYFDYSTKNERSLSLTIKKSDMIDNTDKITAQYTGKNLLETINEICKQYNLGFIIQAVRNYALSSNHTTNQFKLLVPVDRSDYIIFSNEYENIYNFTYALDKKDLNNVALIAGTGEGDARKKFTLYKDFDEVVSHTEYLTSDKTSYQHFDRTEVYIDVRDSETTDFEDDTAYGNSLIPTAREQFKDITEAFDTELFTDGVFKYGIDFFLGDYVTIRKYHLNIKAQVTEVIESIDENGYKATPIFTY